MRLFEDFKDAENPGESTAVQHSNLVIQDHKESRWHRARVLTLSTLERGHQMDG